MYFSLSFFGRKNYLIIRVVNYAKNLNNILLKVLYIYVGEAWLGFPDIWSGQRPQWNWYLSHVVNFSKVQRAQLAKSTLLTSTLVPLGSFRSFKICSDAKERVGLQNATGSYHTYSVPGKAAALVSEYAVENLPSAELQPRFCPWAEHTDDFDISTCFFF